MAHREHSEIQRVHRDLLSSLSGTGLAEADAVSVIDSHALVDDSPSKSYVLDKSGERMAVLIVANSVNPSLVERSVRKAAEAKTALGERLGRILLQPIASGNYDGLSYAAWPLRRDLSKQRIVRAVQKRLVVRHVLRWLGEATDHTICRTLDNEQREQMYALPLAKMQDQARYPAQIREAAARALTHFRDGTRPAVAVLQHSDLWLGNVLLPAHSGLRALFSGDFYIIDWSGSSRYGHPFFDLLVFSDSTRISPGRLQTEIVHHSKLVGCRPVDAADYAIAALALLATNLEHFPEASFLKLCDRVLSRLPKLQWAITTAGHRKLSGWPARELK